MKETFDIQKLSPIIAVKWNKTNIDDVKSIMDSYELSQLSHLTLSDSNISDDKDFVNICFMSPRENTVLEPGDYFLKTADKKVYSCKGDTFDKVYKNKVKRIDGNVFYF